MTHVRYSTSPTDGPAALSSWSAALSRTYFDLQLAPKDAAHFNGSLDVWHLKALELSRLESDGASYARLPQHAAAGEGQLLVTVPLHGELELSRGNDVLHCVPGRFLLELSDQPYRIAHGSSGLMWVLKRPVQTLQWRIGEPTRYFGRSFDRLAGAGRLFGDYLGMLMATDVDTLPERAQALAGSQLVDLLALTLEQHPGAAESHGSTLRRAHLARIDDYLRAHLGDPRLTPQRIADGCGISLRYLHDLHKDRDMPVAERIRHLRLQAAHDALLRGGAGVSVAQVAGDCGFVDLAGFSHAFRRRFGHPPSELLRRVAAAAP